MRIGQQHRSFQKTGFLHPGGAGHFSVPVKGIHRGRYRRIAVLLSKRQNGGDPCADRALANNEFSLAFHQRCLTNLHPSHIRNRVEVARRTLKWNSQIARTHHPRGDVSLGTETGQTKKGDMADRDLNAEFLRPAFHRPKKEYYQLSKKFVCQSTLLEKWNRCSNFAESLRSKTFTTKMLFLKKSSGDPKIGAASVDPYIFLESNNTTIHE